MSVIDWVIVAAYAALVIGIGAWATRKQEGTDEYFRGSRKLPWWAVGISLIATAFSAASLLGAPGEGYHHGFRWIQLQLGDLIGYAIVCIVFLPVLVRLDITTAYEYLERRFDAKTRALGAFFFLAFVLVRLGGLLYAASLCFSVVAEIPVPTAIVIVGLVSIGYTVAGGIAAVVWTDVLQFVMILVGVGAALIVAANGIEGDLLETARESGRLTVVSVVKTDEVGGLGTFWDPTDIRTLPVAVIAYGTLVFGVAATNQQMVQRYVCCDDVASARKAVMLGWFSGFVGIQACLLLGVLLHSYYEARPGALVGAIRDIYHADEPGIGLSAIKVAPDQILPVFIARELPVGVAGLLVATVFAAAMSSIDSALHSLSTCLVVDGYRRFIAPAKDDAHHLRVARGLIIFWGLVGIVVAFYVARTKLPLLPFLVKYTAFTVGPLLGLFLLGFTDRRANGHGAFFGTIGATVVLAIAFAALGIPGIWFSAFAAPVTVLLGAAISLAFAAPRPDQLDLGAPKPANPSSEGT